MKRTTTRRVGVAALASLSLVLVACSSSANSGTASNSSPAASPPATSAGANPPASSASTPGSSAASSLASAAAATSGTPAATAGSAATAGPTGSSAAATTAVTLPNGGKPVTITFWEAYSAASEIPMLEKTVIPAFEKLYPNVTVKDVTFSHDDLYQKLLTGEAAGQLPDVVRSDIAWTPTFAQQKVFAQLDGSMPDFQSLADATFPGNLSTNFYQGHYYGLPLDTNTRVLLSNGAAYASVGLKPPTTIAEMVKDAPLLKAKGIYVYADGGTGGWNVLPFIWSAGGSLTNDSYTTATGYVNSAATVAAVQTLVDLYKGGYIPNIMLGAQGGLGTSDGVATGKYASDLDGPWAFPTWQSAYPNFKPVETLMPSGSGGSISVVGGEDINMVASTQHQDAVEDFMAYMLSPQAQLDMTKAGQLSVRQDLRSQVTAIQPYYATYLQQLATAKARTPVPNYPKIDTIIATEVGNAMSGKKTAQQAMDDAASEIDPLLPKS